MFRYIPEIDKAVEDFPDLVKFLKEVEGRFGNEGPVFISRAPGRLDVMGGISDYSGGTVLQLPIDKACFAAVQAHQNHNLLEITSLRADSQMSQFRCHIKELTACRDYQSAREMFRDHSWAAYVGGCLIVLDLEGYLTANPPGLTVLLKSDVPEGKGVSSSACLEVSAMKAIVSALELDIPDLDLASLCQKVENKVVGASCGIMDQMTAMMGRKDKIMKLLCQPCTLLGHLDIPDELSIVGVDSGERHSISGSDYASVRIGAFMGLKIINSQRSDATQLDYLAQLTTDDVTSVSAQLPDQISGKDFLSKYGSHGDSETEINHTSIYSVKAPALHPIYERSRVEKFSLLLESKESQDDLGTQLGPLMHASHEAYQKLGLDSLMTNLLYSITKSSDHGIFGGKISGGGSGGTVCILLNKQNQSEAINHICHQFNLSRKAGGGPLVFSGSSDGAHHFGCFKLEFL